MKYIPRRYLLKNDDDQELELSESQLYKIESPLVILGEPGSGKSAVAKQLEKIGLGKYVSATSIESIYPTGVEPSLGSLVIDGVDEITAYEGSGSPINKVLSRLAPAVPFILTCRAADWQSANKQIISQKWSEAPLIVKLQALNDQEIEDFVTESGIITDGTKFISDAKKHDVFELLRNPQYLLMFLNAVVNEGWPTSKSQLQKSNSEFLVSEVNPVHGSFNKNKLSKEQLIDASGFICAQLLLSGYSKVAVDKEERDAIQKAELSSDKVNADMINSALQTKVFRAAGEGILEVCHRTTAEYLAAQWISKMLKEKLSARRLEGLIYGSHEIVPASLRGLNAWLATLHSPISKRLIQRDPYGVFRYGDVSALGTTEVKFLLTSLSKIADSDPYFRNSDWNSINNGIGKAEIKKEVISIIKDPKSPYQLTHLLLESIKGDKFTRELKADLVAILFDPSFSNLVRLEALEVLVESGAELDWKGVLEQLVQLQDFGSLRASVELVEAKTDLFNGKEIAKTLVELMNKMKAQNSVVSGIGWSIQDKLSKVQLDDALDFLSGLNKSEDEQDGPDEPVSDELIFRFAKKRFAIEIPTALQVIGWLWHTEVHSYSLTSWKKYANEFFETNVNLRNEIQTIMLRSAKDDREYRMINVKLGYLSCWLREQDVIRQLHVLNEDRKTLPLWTTCWSSLVFNAKASSGFTGFALAEAEKMAKTVPDLLTEWQIIEVPREKPEWVLEQEKYEENRKVSELKKETERHDEFLRVKDQIKDGCNLNALNSIAGTYLGYYTDFEEEDPVGRVSSLVGKDLTEIALEGLAAAALAVSVPKIEEMIRVRADEGKVYFLETIVLAYCSILHSVKNSMHSASSELLEIALYACRWRYSYDSHGSLFEYQKALEEIVLSSDEATIEFFRKTVEPFLNSPAEVSSALYRFAREEKFNSISGKLALDWLEKYDSLSAQVLEEILVAAIRNGNRGDLVLLLRKKIESKLWADEKTRGIWVGIAFFIDFEFNEQSIIDFANTGKDSVWVFRDILDPGRAIKSEWPAVTPKQDNFIIKSYGQLWPKVGSPSGWSGDQNPWDAADFITKRIVNLALNDTNEGTEYLVGLVALESMDSYKNEIKHQYAQHIRLKAENERQTPSLEGVRRVLMMGEPQGHVDLQQLLLDELDELQDRIQNSSHDEMQAYWDSGLPCDENICRNRIAAVLGPILERKGLRLDSEPLMPNSNRCDLRVSYGTVDVPMEIKGQWHSELWTAANEQLINYTKEYHANGYGIYLVLWFGNSSALNAKNSRGWVGQARPTSKQQMIKLLRDRYITLSQKTKIFVLDVSLPEKYKNKIGGKSKNSTKNYNRKVVKKASKKIVRAGNKKRTQKKTKKSVKKTSVISKVSRKKLVRVSGALKKSKVVTKRK